MPHPIRRCNIVQERRRRQRELDVAKAAIILQTALRIRRESIRFGKCARRYRQAQQQKDRAMASSRLIQVAWRQQKAKYKLSGNGRAALSVLYPNLSSLKITSAPSTRDDGDQRSSEQSISDPSEKQLSVRDLNDSISQDKEDTTAAPWEKWAERSPLVKAEGLDMTHYLNERDVRPRTAAAAVESKPLPIQMPISSATRHPAGMMTVKVKIGKEETSLVTPIVVTENDDTEVSVSESAERRGPRENSHGFAKQNDTDSRVMHGESIPALGEITGATTAGRCQTPVVPASTTQESFLHFDETPAVQGIADVLPMVFPLTGTAPEHAETLNPVGVPGTLNPGGVASDKSMTHNNHPDAQPILPVPPVATMARRNPLRATTKINERIYPVEGSEVDVHPRQVVTSVDSFMEDSQVYLGCSFCGVKFLVEAVDARLPESVQGA